MTKYSWFILLLSGIIFFQGCSGENTAESLDPDKNKFFNVEEYFSGEIERLEEIEPPVTKTLRLNDKEEVLHPDTINFANELSVFVNSGINKVSWLDLYSADTTRTDNGTLQQTRYEAQADKLRTRLIDVTYENGKPSVIEIHNRTENIVLDATQQLIYRPGKEAIIKQEQQIRFMEPNSLQIRIQFVQ